MGLKIIKFENLYNIDFAVDIVAAMQRRWEPNTFGTNRFWNMERVRDGILLFHNCDGILHVKNGEEISIKRGELMYVPANLKYGIKLINCLEGYYIDIIDYRMFDFDGNSLTCSDAPVKLYSSLVGSFLSHHAKLYDTMNKEPRFYLKCNSVVYDFLSDIIQMYRKDMHSEMRYMNISKAVTYLEQNYTQPISNKFLANLCSISQDCFIRTFKMYYDTTPRKYILDLRISKAKEMLVSQSKTVSEIAYALGFESPTYFTNMFKKKVGVSPSQYKNRRI